jgi:hypothetical protein
MEEERLARIGNVTDMSEEKLYRDELFTQEDYLKDDGTLDVGAWIIRTTYEIWDMQMPGRIDYYYTDDAVIYEGAGEKIEGKEAIIENTLQGQAPFPDLEIKILDVFWEGNEEDGYKTTMPRYRVGTNTGHSQYGPPTGKELTRDNKMDIANCLVEKIEGEWQYTAEWVRHDSKATELVCTPDDELPEE